MSTPSFVILLVMILGALQTALSIPQSFVDEYPPDALTAITPQSAGGVYFLRLINHRSLSSSTFVTQNPSLAPHFFIRRGQLYAMTNETHILRAEIVNMTAESTPPGPFEAPYKLEFRTLPPKPSRWQKKSKQAVMKEEAPIIEEVPAMWKWGGPTLMYSLERYVDGHVFYACALGTYITMDAPTTPEGCSKITLHSKGEFDRRMMGV